MSNTPVSNLPNQADLQIEVLFDAGVNSPASAATLERAAAVAAANRGFDQGEIGIRITSDPEIRQINRRHLNHDYATDVISFPYRCDSPRIEGEIVLSADTARQQAIEIGRSQTGWNAQHELLLYVVHGVLHLTGMDDLGTDDRRRMRAAEQIIMRQLGVDQIDRFGADTLASLATERHL